MRHQFQCFKLETINLNVCFKCETGENFWKLLWTWVQEHDWLLFIFYWNIWPTSIRRVAGAMGEGSLYHALSLWRSARLSPVNSCAPTQYTVHAVYSCFALHLFNLIGSSVGRLSAFTPSSHLPRLRVVKVKVTAKVLGAVAGSLLQMRCA